MQGALLGERDFGVLLSVVTLLLGVVARNYEGYEGLVPKLVRLLERLRNKDVTPDYAYYGIPSPWLQVRPCALQGGAPPARWLYHGRLRLRVHKPLS